MGQAKWEMALSMDFSVNVDIREVWFGHGESHNQPSMLHRRNSFALTIFNLHVSNVSDTTLGTVVTANANSLL